MTKTGFVYFLAAKEFEIEVDEEGNESLLFLGDERLIASTHAKDLAQKVFDCFAANPGVNTVLRMKKLPRLQSEIEEEQIKKINDLSSMVEF